MGNQKKSELKDSNKHSSNLNVFCVGAEVLIAVAMKISVSWDIMMAYSFTLKIWVMCSFKTSVDFHQTTCHYMPEDRTLTECFH
jgi:hypothetical protein